MSDYRYMDDREFAPIADETARRHRWYSDDSPDEDGMVRIIAGQDAEIDRLRDALDKADALLRRLAVDDDWEDAEGVAVADALREYHEARERTYE